MKVRFPPTGLRNASVVGLPSAARLLSSAFFPRPGQTDTRGKTNELLSPPLDKSNNFIKMTRNVALFPFLFVVIVPGSALRVSFGSLSRRKRRCGSESNGEWQRRFGRADQLDE
jgi:hypothetical protein